MTLGTVNVRIRWSHGRIETPDPMPAEVATQEIQGLGDDGQWYSFRYLGEIDDEGFLVFDQAPEPLVVSPGSPSPVVVLSARCFTCKQEMSIHCRTNLGFSFMHPYAVECPSCSKISEMPLPGDILDILKSQQSN